MTAIPPPGDFGDGGGGEIRDTPLSQALSERYLAYALSTIVSRSLPDVRDGLKPVHRRLLAALRAPPRARFPLSRAMRERATCAPMRVSAPC